MTIDDELCDVLLGFRPAGHIFGMPVLIDPRIPNDRIRFVDPVSGRHTDVLLDTLAIAD